MQLGSVRRGGNTSRSQRTQPTNSIYKEIFGSLSYKKFIDFCFTSIIWPRKMRLKVECFPPTLYIMESGPIQENVLAVFYFHEV
jgi:hypothetical protein